MTQDLWSYQYITELNKAGVLPSSEKFQGQEEETRGNLVLYLYNMDQGVFKDRKKSRDKKKEKAAPNFTDVTKDSPYYDAVCWAYQNGLVGGTTETTFAPEHSLTGSRCAPVVGPVCGPGKRSLCCRWWSPTSLRTPCILMNMPAAG